MSNINKTSDNYILGKGLITAGINLDQGLADLLKFQIKSLKRLVAEDSSMNEIQKANMLLRDIIIALSMTEEKIRSGILLCEDDKSEPAESQGASE